MRPCCWRRTRARAAWHNCVFCISHWGMGVLLLLLLAARGRVEAPVHCSGVAAGSRSLVAAVGGVIEVAPDLHRERQEGHPLALHDVPVLEYVRCYFVVLDEFPRRLGARLTEQGEFLAFGFFGLTSLNLLPRAIRRDVVFTAITGSSPISWPVPHAVDALDSQKPRS